jgi:hypothetical protein
MGGQWQEPAGEYTFFYRTQNENHELGTGFLCERESYQQLRGLSLLVIGCHMSIFLTHVSEFSKLSITEYHKFLNLGSIQEVMVIQPYLM